MNFKIKTSKKDDTIIVSIVGNIMGVDVARIHEKIESIKKSHAGRIAIDLEETSFIDSHGLGVLIFAWKAMEQENRDLVLVSASKYVEDMLKSTNLHKVITIIDSVDKL